MKTPRPLPEELRGRPFAVADASFAGVSARRLRHRSLTRRGKGIREDNPTAERPLSVRVRPFIEINKRCAASHQTAAVKLYEDEVTVRQGIPVTTPERTWLDLAEVLNLDALVVAGEGERGLKLMRVGSDSPQETLLRLAIIGAGLPEPELNIPILDAEGTTHHEPDLSYRKYRIGIEYEGEHHGEELQVVRDITRSERYFALGWTDVRISKRHMMDDGKQAAAKVRTALVQAGWRPGR